MVARGYHQLVAEANAAIETIRAEDAVKLANDPNVVFVDVREAVEREATGAVKGAVHAPRGLLEQHADPNNSRHLKEFSSGKRLVLYCGSGGRSALAAKTLKEMGIENAASLAGGFLAWQQSRWAD